MMIFVWNKYTNITSYGYIMTMLQGNKVYKDISDDKSLVDVILVWELRHAFFDFPSHPLARYALSSYRGKVRVREGKGRGEEKV